MLKPNYFILLLVLLFCAKRISAFPTAISNNETEVISAICDETGLEDGQFKPHPYECNKYFECTYNTAILLTCPDGLVFSPELKTCDWPYNVDCVNTPYPTLPTTSIEPPTEVPTTPEPTTPETTTPEPTTPEPTTPEPTTPETTTPETTTPETTTPETTTPVTTTPDTTTSKVYSYIISIQVN